MANMHMKKCLALLVTRKIGIKTKIRSHHPTVKMVKTLATPNIDRDVEQQKLNHCRAGVQDGSVTSGIV